MAGFLVSLVLATLAFSLQASRTRHYRPWERRLISYGLLAHYVGSLALISIYLYYYGYGDMLGYHRTGGMIADHLSADFANVAPKVFDLLLGRGGEELVPNRAGGSTGSMHAVAGILSFLLGDSLLASSIFIATGAFIGKLALYSVFRRELAPEAHRAALIGSLLVPSAIFWSGSLLKESVVMFFLGTFVWGGYTLVSTRARLSGAIGLAIGVVGCALFKGYLLVPAAVAGMVWFYVRRTQLTKTEYAKPIYLVLAGAAILGLLVLIGNYDPRYDVFRAEKQLVEEAETMGRSEGGSNYTLLRQSDTASSFGLILKAPWAVVTACLRPAIIEARNPLALANGLETLVLTTLLIGAVRKNGFAGCVRTIRNSPILAFCAVFTLLLALGVGFATTNMGTLSRYRMPLIPFFVVLLGVLGTKPKRRQSS